MKRPVSVSGEWCIKDRRDSEYRPGSGRKGWWWGDVNWLYGLYLMAAASLWRWKFWAAAATAAAAAASSAGRLSASLHTDRHTQCTDRSFSSVCYTQPATTRSTTSTYLNTTLYTVYTAVTNGRLQSELQPRKFSNFCSPNGESWVLFSKVGWLFYLQKFDWPMRVPSRYLPFGTPLSVNCYWGQSPRRFLQPLPRRFQRPPHLAFNANTKLLAADCMTDDSICYANVAFFTARA